MVLNLFLFIQTFQLIWLLDTSCVGRTQSHLLKSKMAQASFMCSTWMSPWKNPSSKWNVVEPKKYK